jgi:transcriptional regulator with GAF, ATPase, and Fis domain
LAATNRDLRKMVLDGTFREDLYFRLSVIQLTLPPLHRRKDDVALLAEHFLEDLGQRLAPPRRLRFSDDALKLLREHPWPGNVRELRNVLERAASLCDGDTITRADLHLPDRGALLPKPDPAPASSAPAPAPQAWQPPEGDWKASYKDAKQAVVERFERFEPGKDAVHSIVLAARRLAVHVRSGQDRWRIVLDARPPDMEIADRIAVDVVAAGGGPAGKKPSGGGVLGRQCLPVDPALGQATQFCHVDMALPQAGFVDAGCGVGHFGRG